MRRRDSPRRPSQWPARLEALAAGVATAGALVVFGWYWPLLSEPWVLGDWGGRIELQRPQWLVGFAVGPGLVWIARRSLAALPWQQVVLSCACRMGFVACLTVALSQPVHRAVTQRTHTVVAVDGSASVSDQSLADAARRIRRAQALKAPTDGLSVVRFGRRAESLALEVGLAGQSLRMPGALAEDSNLQAAIQLASGLFPEEFVPRLVLLTDGRATVGATDAEVSAAAARGLRISTIAPAGAAPVEVAITEVQFPDNVAVGQPFRVRVRVVASEPLQAKVTLSMDGRPNSRQPSRVVSLQAGPTDVLFPSVVRLGGTVSYRAELQDVPSDTFEQNNIFTRSVVVPGRPRVLVVDGQPARIGQFAQALTAQQFDVDVRGPLGLPAQRQSLEEFDAVVLSDVAARSVSARSQEALEAYVREGGGALLMAGGRSGLSLGGWSGTALERIMPVSMGAQAHQEKPGVALALVIDRSGSMTGLPLEMAKAACSAAVETLRSNDRLEVIAFDSAPRRFVPMQPARYRKRIQSQIATISPGGGTGLFDALDAAYQDISVTEARKKHVILLTDGQADSDGLEDLVQAMIAERITVTTVGLGDNTDSSLLGRLARAGGGRFHAVPDPSNLPRIFTRETQRISRDDPELEWFGVRRVGRADFLSGLSVSDAPYLHGYVATTFKGPPSQLILQSDQGEPVLARRRVGLGWTLAWTSDLKSRWAVEWLQWPDFGKFWGQLLREHLRVDKRQRMDMNVSVQADGVHATVDAFHPDGTFDNSLRSRVVVRGPLPESTEQSYEMPVVAPGRYTAVFVLPQVGNYLLEAQHSAVQEDGAERVVAVSNASVSKPYLSEYAELGTDVSRLQWIARQSGGTVEPTEGQWFDPGTDSVVVLLPRWSWLVFAAIGFLLFDVLCRRVRLFDRNFGRSSAS